MVEPEEIEVIIAQQAPVSRVDGDTAVTEMPDGSIEYDFEYDGSALSQPAAGGFDENLAERMSSSELLTLADRLIEYHRVDLESRKDWDSMKSRALRMLGAEQIPDTSLPFPGAARAFHPVIAEAVVQFQANAMEEFFPATGPVKVAVAGDSTDETRAQAQRVEDFMNYYLTEVDRGYYPDTDQELFVLPIDGSTFKKTFVDPVDGMPKSRFVRAEDFIVPYYSEQDLRFVPRYAHRDRITGEMVKQAISRGAYRDIDLVRSAEVESMEVDVREKSDRRQRALHEDDRLYTRLEYHVELTLPEGVDPLVDEAEEEFQPCYVVELLVETREVLSIRRLWREDVPGYQKQIWFSHKKFLPGLGFYGWGFPHVIGSLGEAASGAVRALLDASLMATVQGGFRAKDGIKKGEALTITPGQWKDVDATAEELAKTFFTPPFREPSPALFQMLQMLVADARRFASITEVLVGQASNRAPVGTTIALIEQSMKLFSAIHKRIFAAARNEFSQLAALIHRYAPYDEYPYHLNGEAKQAFKADFDERVDVLPVADPNIISSVQRIALAQAVLELMGSDPSMYEPEQRAAAHTEMLKALKVPYADKITPKVPKPNYVDPVTENALMMVGKGVRAFAGQLHDMHIMAHQNMVMTAQGTLPADQFEPIYQNAMAHIREHMALAMMEVVSGQMMQAAGVPMPPIDILNNDEDMPPELEQAITVVATKFLPPPPPPPQEQGQQDDGAAQDAEVQAKIERETAAFVAKQAQDEERHKQELRQRDELHAQKLKQMDDETAARIIRENADAIARRRQMEAEGVRKMAMEGRRDQMKTRMALKAAEQKSALQSKKGKP